MFFKPNNHPMALSIPCGRHQPAQEAPREVAGFPLKSPSGQPGGQDSPKSPSPADPPARPHKGRLGRICPCDLNAAQGLFHVCQELDALAALYK